MRYRIRRQERWRMGYASMTYAGKGILEEYFKDREKIKNHFPMKAALD